RYVLGVPQARLAEFAALCERERCPFAVVGVATAAQHLTVGYGVFDAMGGGDGTEDSPGPAQRAGRSDHPHGSAVQAGGPHPIDLPMDVLFGKPPKMHRDASRPAPVRWRMLNSQLVDLREA